MEKLILLCVAFLGMSSLANAVECQKLQSLAHHARSYYGDSDIPRGLPKEIDVLAKRFAYTRAEDGALLERWLFQLISEQELGVKRFSRTVLSGPCDSPDRLKEKVSVFCASLENCQIKLKWNIVESKSSYRLDPEPGQCEDRMLSLPSCTAPSLGEQLIQDRCKEIAFVEGTLPGAQITQETGAVTCSTSK